MYDLDFSTLVTTINSFFELVHGILRLDPQAIEAVYTQEGGYRMAIAILILGGISLGLGQSVVLLANRVRRRRFALSLLSSGVVLLLFVAFWAGTVWLLSRLLVDQQAPYPDLLLGASISMAPLLFGFLVLFPYIGVVIFTLLRVWVLLTYIFVVNTIQNSGYWWGFLLCLGGWLLMELIFRFPPLKFDRLRNWYWRFSTGTPRRMKIEEIVGRFLSEIRSAAGSDIDKPDQGAG